jgi:hypothetical protein
LITQSINVLSIYLIETLVLFRYIYTSSVVIINGTNPSDWFEQVQFHLGVLNLDLVLQTKKLSAIIDSSSVEEKTIYKS